MPMWPGVASATTLGLLRIATDGVTATASVEQEPLRRACSCASLGRTLRTFWSLGRSARSLLVPLHRRARPASSDRLVDELNTQVLRGYKQVHVRYETTSVQSLDGRQSQIRALGRKHGADVVVWGACSAPTSGRIRPRVTMVPPDSRDLGVLREEPEKDTPYDELQASQRSTKRSESVGAGLRAWRGLRCTKKTTIRDAVWHFDRARQGREMPKRCVRC